MEQLQHIHHAVSCNVKNGMDHCLYERTSRSRDGPLPNFLYVGSATSGRLYGGSATSGHGGGQPSNSRNPLMMGLANGIALSRDRCIRCLPPVRRAVRSPARVRAFCRVHQDEQFRPAFGTLAPRRGAFRSTKTEAGPPYERYLILTISVSSALQAGHSNVWFS